MVVELNELHEMRIAVIGLGYVGLPLAAAFAKKFDVVGFDISASRVDELASGFDRTREVSVEELASLDRLQVTQDASLINDCDIYIVTTPTPIDEYKRPDLGPVLAATKTVADVLQPGNIVIYESTVYPGATEDECVPLLEAGSGLNFNIDFFVGYSPERINPGDRDHRFETIVKVTSGSTPEVARVVDMLYGSVVAAGTYQAPTIKVAEAAKVIENTQRDVNIALVNELAMLFDRLGIDTHEVLEAAGTKWNFLPFRPGLVGGHCIGVDPYYLTHKAQSVGHHPEVILAGRRINDSMGEFVASKLVAEMLRRRIDFRDARILVLGLTFKENTPDLRNTRVVDVIVELRSLGLSVDVHDPWATRDEAAEEYDLDLLDSPPRESYDAILLAVPHREFLRLGGRGIRAFGRPAGHVLYDLKSALPTAESDLRL